MKKRWTQEEIDFLKLNYNRRSISYIAERLGRTECSVHKKAKRLGLTSRVRNWTEKEIDILSNYWGKKSIENLSKLLKRSIVSIKKKARELNLGPQYIANGEYLTTGNIGYLLNKNPDLVLKWIKEGYIKGKPFGRKGIYQVCPNDFLDFLKEHPEKWCGIRARIDLIKPYFHTSSFAHVPNWFNQKVNYDREMYYKQFSAM